LQKPTARENRNGLIQFLIPLEIVEFDQAAATVYGAIRSDLESRGLVIGAMDMLIAAHALSLGVTLVSNNVREFSRIANLSLENWAE
jgi:tRNA(fMet)-specific endonuclease VapC